MRDDRIISRTIDSDGNIIVCIPNNGQGYPGEEEYCYIENRKFRRDKFNTAPYRKVGINYQRSIF